MTNQEKIREAERLLLEVIKDEANNDNVNKTALLELSDTTVTIIVNHWYTMRESEMFWNEDKEEIDEFLNVGDYSFLLDK